MLQHKVALQVRFNETDPLGIVWHGHYVRYFEDGREAFGKEYGLSYLDFYHQGLVVPVVSVQCDYKKPLRYGDTMVIRTTFLPGPAAKINFRYEIFDAEERYLVATGSTTQVFVDKSTFELLLLTPAFFEEWKNRWNL